MRAVDIGIRHDDDLVIAELRDIEVIVNAGTKRRDHRTDLRITVYSVQTCFFHIEDLAAERQDSLRSAVSGCFGGTAGRISLNDKDLTLGRILI